MEPSPGPYPPSPGPRPVPPPRRASGERKTIISEEHKGFWEICTDTNDRGPLERRAHAEGGKGQQREVSGIMMQIHGTPHHHAEESNRTTEQDTGQSRAPRHDAAQSHGATEQDTGQSRAPRHDAAQSHGATERDTGQSRAPRHDAAQSHGATEQDTGQSRAPRHDAAQSHGATERDTGQSRAPRHDAAQSHGATERDTGQSRAPRHDAAQSHGATEQDAEHHRPQNDVVQSQGSPGQDGEQSHPQQCEDTDQSSGQSPSTATKQDHKASQQSGTDNSHVISQPPHRVPVAWSVATPNLNTSQRDSVATSHKAVQHENAVWSDGALEQGSCGPSQQGSLPVTQGSSQQGSLPDSFRISELDEAVHSVTTQGNETHVTQQQGNVVPYPLSHDSSQQDRTILQNQSAKPQQDRVGPGFVTLAEQCTMEARVAENGLSASNSAPRSDGPSLAAETIQKKVSHVAPVIQISVTQEELTPQPQSKTIHSSSEQHFTPEREPTAGASFFTSPGAAPLQVAGTSSQPCPGVAQLSTTGTPSQPSPGVAQLSTTGAPSQPSPGVAQLSTTATPSEPSPGVAQLSTTGTPSQPSPGVAQLSTTGTTSQPSPGVAQLSTTGTTSQPSPGVAQLSTTGTTPQPSTGVAQLSTTGTTSQPSPGVAQLSTTGTTSQPSPGVAQLSTTGTTSQPSPGVAQLSTTGTTSQPSPGVAQLSTTGTTSQPSPGVAQLSTTGTTSQPSPGVAQLSTTGTTPQPSTGVAQLSTTGTTSQPSPGVAQLSTTGTTSQPSPGVAQLSTTGTTSQPSPGVAQLSTAVTPSQSSLEATSVSTAVARSNTAAAAASVSSPVAPPRSSPGGASVSAAGGSALSPVRVLDTSSPHRNMSSKPPLPTPPRSNLYPGPPPTVDADAAFRHETASLSSYRSKGPAPDTLSYLDSVSLMSGTLESLSVLDDASSVGSDSEINGAAYRKTDKYGFLGGNQYSSNGEMSIPVEISRQRELKWLDMFNHWDKWLSRRFQKVKLRCRKGIPSSLRSKAWQHLSNSHELLARNPGKFEELERHPGDPKWLDVIEKDLHRQFPFHEMFAARGGHGQQDLYRILKAYTIYRPEEGYCQAQAPVAAVLLMHMPAEQAFWCLVQICDKYLPGYYSAGLEAIQLDGEIFFALLRRVCPMAYRHLKKFKIDPILYMTEWFMCIFSRTLPWASVLRVWDMFFCEGVKIVFRVGLVLLRHTLGSVDKLRSCQGMYETMEKLRSLSPHCMHEDILLPEVSSLPVTDALIERESNTQLRKWRENRGELQYRPSRRLHGARQIQEEKQRLNPSLSGSRLSLASLRRASPPPTAAAQPESVVVSEGLRPVLPSPTANKTPLGPPKAETKKTKEKQREQEKRREKEEKEERERQRKREKEERERERKREKEEKRAQKDKEKVDSKPKKERKFSFRRKEPSSPASDLPRKGGKGPADGEGGAVHDTYF